MSGCLSGPPPRACSLQKAEDDTAGGGLRGAPGASDEELSSCIPGDQPLAEAPAGSCAGPSSASLAVGPPGGPSGGVPALLHFDAGSLLLTGVSVGLALYDWALHIVRGAPGLLHPAGSQPAGAGGGAPQGSPHPCRRCALLGMGGIPPVASPGSARKAGGGSRRRGPPRRSQGSAMPPTCGSWAPAPRGGPLEDQPALLLPREASLTGVSVSSALEDPLGGRSAGEPLLRLPFLSAQATASTATSAVRKTRRYFAAKASAGSEAAQGGGAEGGPEQFPLRITDGTAMGDEEGLMLCPEILPKGQAAASLKARGIAGASAKADLARDAAAQAVAATAVESTSRAFPSAEGLAVQVTLGAPKGPSRLARSGLLGFRGDTKTAASRLRLRLRHSRGAFLPHSTLCTSAGGAPPGRPPNCPRECCEPGGPELVAIALHGISQGSPARPGSPQECPIPQGTEGPQGHPHSAPNEAGVTASFRSHPSDCGRAIPHNDPGGPLQREQHQQKGQEAPLPDPDLRWALRRIRAVALQLKEVTARRMTPQGDTGIATSPTVNTSTSESLGNPEWSGPALRTPPAGKIEGSEPFCSRGLEETLDREDTSSGQAAPWESACSGAPSGSPGQLLTGEAVLRQRCSRGAPQRGPRGSWLQVVPASAGASPTSTKIAGSPLNPSLIPWGPWVDEPPARNTLELGGLTVTRVTPKVKPQGPRRRGELPRSPQVQRSPESCESAKVPQRFGIERPAAGELPSRKDPWPPGEHSINQLFIGKNSSGTLDGAPGIHAPSTGPQQGVR